MCDRVVADLHLPKLTEPPLCKAVVPFSTSISGTLNRFLAAAASAADQRTGERVLTDVAIAARLRAMTKQVPEVSVVEIVALNVFVGLAVTSTVPVASRSSNTLSRFAATWATLGDKLSAPPAVVNVNSVFVGVRANSARHVHVAGSGRQHSLRPASCRQSSAHE